MKTFLAKIFTITFAVAISGCAVTPIAPTAPPVAPRAPVVPESKQAPRLVETPRSTPQPVAMPQVKKTKTVTYDCLLDAAGNRTTDCLVVPNGTTTPRASVRGTKEESYTPALKPSNGTGPDVLGSEEACNTALRTGNYRNYEPKYFGGKNNNPVDGEKRKAVPFERDKCVKLHVVGGPGWVVQKSGTLFRFNVKPDGSLEDVPYARDDCGNKVYAVADLPPEKRTVPGDWIRRYGIFTDEVVEEVVVQTQPRLPVVRRPVVPIRCCIPRPRCINCCPPVGYGGGYSNGNGYGYSSRSYQSYQGQEGYRGYWSPDYYNQRR